MKLTYHRAVQGEVEDACAWYDERKDGLGDEFFAEVVRRLDAIVDNPLAFPQVNAGRRKAALKRFPYSIFYRIHTDRVRVLSIRHDKRHPSYGFGRK